MKHPEGVINIFPTQIGTYHIDLDKEIIYSDMPEYKVGPLQVLEGGITSYARGSASDFFLSDERLTSLVQNIYSKLNEYTDTLHFEPCEISQSWFNKMDRTGSVRQHRHTGSVISGALYVDAPSNTSPLVFSDPLNGCRMMELCKKPQFQYGLDVYDGLLILFPSWLQHETFSQQDPRLLFQQTKPRTVISFNTYHALTSSL